MEVLDTFGRDNTARMTDEALMITRHKGVKLNSKKEYRQPDRQRGMEFSLSLLISLLN